MLDDNVVLSAPNAQTVTDQQEYPCCEGTRSFYCGRCKTVVKTETLPAVIGHREKTTVTPATCNTWGSSVTVCERCNKTLGHSSPGAYPLDPTNHASLGGWTTVTAATCLQPEVQKAVCTACNATETREVGGVASCSYTAVGPPVVQPTCTTVGKALKACALCGKPDPNGGTVDIPALGHDWSGRWKTDR